MPKQLTFDDYIARLNYLNSLSGQELLDALERQKRDEKDRRK